MSQILELPFLKSPCFWACLNFSCWLLNYLKVTHTKGPTLKTRWQPFVLHIFPLTFTLTIRNKKLDNLSLTTPASQHTKFKQKSHTYRLPHNAQNFTQHTFSPKHTKFQQKPKLETRFGNFHTWMERKIYIFVS
jgi:hypothetical protein